MHAEIQEWKFFVFLWLNGELNVWIDVVDMFSELIHVVLIKYSECVIHIM